MPLACMAPAQAQDQVRFYFTGEQGLTGNIGAFTVDNGGNFWTGSLGATGGVRRVVGSGSSWTTTEHIPSLDWAFFYRSDNVPGGITHPSDWGGNINGAIGGFLLNPAPLTINIQTGSGSTVARTYQAGELAFISDGFGTLADQNGIPREDVIRRLYRYDLRRIDGPTSVQPDYNTAGNGSTVFGSFGVADWNDVLAPVVSELALRAAANEPGGSSTFARQFAWSSNGQRIYAIDSGAGPGGIFRIDPTQTNSITQVWKDKTSGTIGSEPGVIHTSVRDLDPTNPLAGDQIVVEGSATGGNAGGANLFFDTGALTTLAAPKVLWTAAEFRNFAGLPSYVEPQYSGFEFDTAGNLYFSETQGDGLYRYDNQGRFSKVLSEREHNNFQNSQGFSNLAQDIKNKVQTRTVTAPGGFSVTEVLFMDGGLETPLGALAYKAGDFDRDNDVDAADLAAFAGALGVRNQGADDTNLRFDLNGDSIQAFESSRNRFEHVTNGQMVIDWLDVKALQQFVAIPTGDVNFDLALNLTDLDVLNANYYTLGGGATEKWTTGDIASVDPLYAVGVADTGLVNSADLLALADAWVNDLSQAAPTLGQLTGRGYTGQFLTDVVAAFDAVGPTLPGDANGDGAVDLLDLDILGANFGSTGATLAQGDFNGDANVDLLDLDILGANFGAMASTAIGVPEPATLAVAAPALLAAGRRRRPLA